MDTMVTEDQHLGKVLVHQFFELVKQLAFLFLKHSYEGVMLPAKFKIVWDALHVGSIPSRSSQGI